MIGSFEIGLIVLYLLFLAGVAVYSLTRKDDSRESLILAGRRLTLPAFVATLVSTWYGGILGVGEFSYRFGLSNWLVFGVPYYLAAAIFALFLAGRARKSMEMTIPDRLDRYYGSAATVAGSTILVIVTLPVAYVLMIGVLGHIALDLPIWVGIVFGTLFSVLYVATGGFRAVVFTDIIQFILMFTGFIVLLIANVTTLGGWDYLQANLPARHFSATGGNSVGYIGLWYIIALATLVEPAFYQRCFAVKSVTDARKGILVSILFWIFFDFMTTSCGLYARACLPDLDNPVAAYPALASKILPPFFMGIFILSLLATIMSTVDSYMFLSGTTISHDLIWRFRSNAEGNLKKYTTLALTICSAVTIGIAVLSESVVGIWHDFGTIGTSALLLPLMTSYWGRHIYTPRGALTSILLASTVAALSLFYPRLTSAENYLFEIEPIYLGLATSAIVFLFARTRKIAIGP